MEILEIVSLVIVGVSLLAVVCLRIIPGSVRIATGSEKKLTIKRDGNGWVVCDDDEQNKPAQNVRVYAGQRITWSVSTDPQTATFIAGERSKIQAQEQAQVQAEERGQYILEISLPSLVFPGFGKVKEHQALMIPRDEKEDVASVSFRVLLLAIPGTYPYSIEITRDTGVFARGGSHTRVHTDPW